MVWDDDGPSEGWVAVRWDSGEQYNYRYAEFDDDDASKGGFDVVRVDSLAAPACRFKGVDRPALYCGDRVVSAPG